MNKKLANHTYEDFVGGHGGRRTKALAGRFRQAKGLSITPAMDAAIMAEAARRTVSQQRRQELGTANSPDLSAEGGGVKPSKPMPGVNHKTLGPPDAPRVGGRTSPGTTPRAKSNKPLTGGDRGNANTPGIYQQHPVLPPGRGGKLTKPGYTVGSPDDPRMGGTGSEEWVARPGLKPGDTEKYNPGYAVGAPARIPGPEWAPSRGMSPADPSTYEGPGMAQLGPATSWNARGQQTNPLKALLKKKPKSRRGNVQRQH